MAGADNREDRYKWVALANTTAGMFMATLDGIHRHHRAAGDLPGHPPGSAGARQTATGDDDHGYRVVEALAVTLGRLGDIYGRVKIYNAGFVVFTAASVLLSFDPYIGGRGARSGSSAGGCSRPSAGPCSWPTPP